MRIAVIDVGSNSVLTTVLDGWTVAFESSAVTGLGTGTRASGLLAEDAMQRTLAALREGHAEARKWHAELVLARATMAARIAGNADEFLARCAEQGTPVEILSGEEEARLGLLSVTADPAFATSRRLSTIDVGGHSTELATADREGDSWRRAFERSYPVGTLALRGGALRAETLSAAELLNASAEIDQTIGLAYRPAECGTVVVLGATGTNLVAIRERMTKWDPEAVHGATLDYEEVGRATGWLASMTDRQRAEVPGMEAGRETTMHLGALILERFLFGLRAESCRVSTRGWRHALGAEFLELQH